MQFDFDHFDVRDKGKALQELFSFLDKEDAILEVKDAKIPNVPSKDATDAEIKALYEKDEGFAMMVDAKAEAEKVAAEAEAAAKAQAAEEAKAKLDEAQAENDEAQAALKE